MQRYGNSREEKQRWICVRVGVAAVGKKRVHQEENETKDGANKNVKMLGFTFIWHSGT